MYLNCRCDADLDRLFARVLDRAPSLTSSFKSGELHHDLSKQWIDAKYFSMSTPNGGNFEYWLRGSPRREGLKEFGHSFDAAPSKDHQLQSSVHWATPCTFLARCWIWFHCVLFLEACKVAHFVLLWAYDKDRCQRAATERQQVFRSS